MCVKYPSHLVFNQNHRISFPYTTHFVFAIINPCSSEHNPPPAAHRDSLRQRLLPSRKPPQLQVRRRAQTEHHSKQRPVKSPHRHRWRSSRLELNFLYDPVLLIARAGFAEADTERQVAVIASDIRPVPPICRLFVCRRMLRCR